MNAPAVHISAFQNCCSNDIDNHKLNPICKKIPVMGEANDHEEKMQTPTATKMLNFNIEGATISAWLQNDKIKDH